MLGSKSNRPKGSVVCLAQVEGLGIQVNNDFVGPKVRQFALQNAYERSQMVGPLALMFLAVSPTQAVGAVGLG